MARFNRAEIPQAIAAFFGVKDAFETDVVQTLQPVVVVGSVLESPYLKYGIPVGVGFSSPAVAARFAHVVIQPGQNVALEIHQLVISNATANVWDLSLRLASATDVATLANLSARTQARDLAGQPVKTLRSSSVRSGDGASSIGIQVLPVVVPANTDRVFTFPDPIVLYGNDDTGLPAVCISNNTANQLLQAHILGKEWPLPG